jgi:hypothetical protein
MDARKPLPLEIFGLILLFARICWRWATPFWLFRDVSRGSFEQRVANYRYNRSRRGVLPSYILKWIALAVVLIVVSQFFSDMLAHASEGTASHMFAALFCVGVGVGLSFSCVVLSILAASYLYLVNVER